MGIPHLLAGGKEMLGKSYDPTGVYFVLGPVVPHVVPVLNMDRPFSLSSSPEQHGVTTVYLVLGVVRNLEML